MPGGRHLPLLAALLGLATACAPAADPSPDFPPAARAPAGPVSPDGVYNGKMVDSGAGGPGGLPCGGNDSVTITIHNSRFRFVLQQPQVDFQRQVVFNIAVAADGGFAVNNGDRFIRGQVAEGHLQAQVAGDACSFDLEADRNGTW